MPNIKLISDFRNYTAVLETVAVGSPVYLTKNGRGCYTIMDIEEEEEQQKKILSGKAREFYERLFYI